MATKKKGRPRKMNDAMKDEAVFLISTTIKSIRVICKAIGITPETFYQEVGRDKTFAEHYMRAKAHQAIIEEEHIKEIARRKSKDRIAAEDKRIEIDTLKWLMSKRLPKVYGTQSEVTVKGDPLAPISISNVDYSQLPNEALEAIIAARVEIPK